METLNLDQIKTFAQPLFVIDQSYYVKSVLLLFTNNGLYYILAISQDEVRLF